MGSVSHDEQGGAAENFLATLEVFLDHLHSDLVVLFCHREIQFLQCPWFWRVFHANQISMCLDPHLN